MRRQLHPEWCAQGHRCNLGEHRATPVPVSLPGIGRAVLTRVQGSDGREHAEIALTVSLPQSAHGARRQLGGLLTDVTTLIQRAQRRAVA